MVEFAANEIELLNKIYCDNYKNWLGTKLQALANGAVDGTPVNGANATLTLTIGGVVIDGETVQINNFNSEPAVFDTYEFLADAGQTKTLDTNIAVDIESYTTKSTINLTVAAQPTSGDTMTIGDKVYTFVPDGTANADGEISIGTDLATAQAAIVFAINGADGHNDPNPLVSAGVFAANVSAITALVGGVAGDAIATTETFTAAGNLFSGATLAGGADCTASNAVTALVAAITASDTQGVGAADGAGDTVVLTADVAGEAGNNILVAEYMANGSFAGSATELAGGVDGTAGALGQMMIDETYLYVCIADNSVDDKNWRRITLGGAY